MKKMMLVLVLLIIKSIGVDAQADTLKLKNGKTAVGIIYKMEDARIFITNGKDSSVFTADELQSIMFCHKTGECCAGDSLATPNKSYPCNENMEAQGTVVFRCNKCGDRGSLSIKGSHGKSETKSLVTFELEKEKGFVEHIEKLAPGEYMWEYKDNSGKTAKGKFVMEKCVEKKIVLFEKE